MITTVVSIDGSDALEWQAELLALSHARVGQPGPLVILRDTVEVPGDDYPPYNKPYAIARWLEHAEPATEQVLVLDPDMVFVRPFVPRVQSGQPLAHDSTYRLLGELARAFARHIPAPERLQSIAVPLALHRRDLARLAPLWFRDTVRLRSDPAVRELAPWICEMWACALAAERLSLRFSLGQHAAVPPFTQRADLPFIHYAFAIDAFDKRSYLPSESPPDGTNGPYRQLRDLIEEYRRTLDRDP